MGEPLTKRQAAILAWINDYIAASGYPPTFREIGDAFAIKSANGVMCHLKELEAKGRIERGTRLARAIRLVESPAAVQAGDVIETAWGPM